MRHSGKKQKAERRDLAILDQTAKLFAYARKRQKVINGEWPAKLLKNTVISEMEVEESLGGNVLQRIALF